MHQPSDIIIAGAGGIGEAVGLLLANYPEIRGRIHIGDRSLEAAQAAARWVTEGKTHPIEISAFHLPETGLEGLDDFCSPGGVVLDCLPGSQAPRMARLALQHQMHYVNLTEYVEETREIKEMAQGASTGFVLQTGLAPGFINILARSLYERFVDETGQEKVEEIVMRVGALTVHTSEPHYYGFTWSPVGVATEYMKQSLVLRDNERQWLKSLSDRESRIIDGRLYEADLTSGGAADLPFAFEGIARNLDYKTLRYPGHYQWVENVIARIKDENEPIKALHAEMVKRIPVVQDDLIVIYASVAGRDEQGLLRKLEKSYHLHPTRISGKKLRAIQATTAAPMAECARLLLAGKWRGIVLQSEIEPQSFLAGPFVERIYNRRVTQNGVSLTV